MHERKARMAELADGFIALPGGFGTLDETLEVLTWNQLGLIAKPVVFLDVDGYFGPLFEFFDRAVDASFVRGAHRMLAQRARTVDEAIAIAIAPDARDPAQVDRPRWQLTRRARPREVDALFGRPGRRGRHAGASSSCATARSSSSATASSPANLFQPDDGAGHAPTRRSISWSMAKSMVHAAVGDPRRRRPHRPRRPGAGAGVGGHREGGDHAARPARDALRACGSSRTTSTASVATASRCCSARAPRPRRVRRRAAARLHPPGTVWNYSSGTTNIICRIIGDLVAGGRRPPATGSRRCGRSSTSGCSARPGMPDADPRFDDAGTWVGSSYVYAPARAVRPVRRAVPARRRGRRRPDPARGVGRPRPHRRRPRPRDRHSATAGTGGCGPTSPARWPPTATRASTSSCSPSTTPSSSTSARPTPRSATGWSPGCARSSALL